MFQRSRLVRAGAAVIAASMMMLAACSSNSDTATPGGESSSQEQKGWEYTDAVGKTVTLDHVPTRIAGFVDQAAALYTYGVKPVAMFGRFDIESDKRLEGLDLTDVALVGTTYGEIDLEALAAAQPEVIVTGIYPTDREGTLAKEGPFYGFADVEQQKQIEKIAPVITIEIGGDGQEVIGELSALAQSLGADADGIAAQKKEFDDAAAHLAEVSKARPEIEVSSMYASADGIYLVKSNDEPINRMWKSIGLNLTDLNPEGDYYWDMYSWENASKAFSGDVLLMNNEGFQKEDLAKQPTFADNPALKADQVNTWSYGLMAYGAQAKDLHTLAGLVEGAKDVAESK